MSRADGPRPEDILSPGDFIVDTAVKVLPSVLAGGPKGPTQAQQERLIEAGYKRIKTGGPKSAVIWIPPDGSGAIGNISAAQVARQMVRNPVDSLPPPPPPSGPSVADQIPGAVIGGAVAGGVGAALPWLYRQAAKALPKLVRKGKRKARRAPRLLAELLREVYERNTPRGRSARKTAEKLFGVTKKAPRGGLLWLILEPSKIGTERTVTRAEILRRFPASAPAKGPSRRVTTAPAHRVAPGIKSVPSAPPSPVMTRARATSAPKRGLPRKRALPAPRVASATSVLEPVTVTAKRIPTASPAAWPSPKRSTLTVPRLARYALPLLLSLPRSAPSKRRRTALAPTQAPLTLVQPSGVGLPPQVGARSKTCDCPPKRKPSRARCRNPVTRRTKRTRAGRTFLTVTRELKCPV